MAFIEQHNIDIETPLKNIVSQACRFSLEAYTDDLFELLSVDYVEKLDRAVVKRKSEYLAGRYVSHRLLASFGYTGFQVTTGSSSQPIWPDALVGSISHCDRMAVAAVASKKDHRGVGVDVENIVSAKTLDGVESQILFDDEKAFVQSWSMDYRTAFTLVFSLKESFFKAVFPLVNFYFGFDAIKITNRSVPSESSLQFTICNDIYPDLDIDISYQTFFKIFDDTRILTYVATD